MVKAFLTDGRDNGKRVEERAGKGPARVLDGALVAERPERLYHVALEPPQVGLHLFAPVLLAVLGAARQVPDPGDRVRPVGRHPFQHFGVVRLALDDDEHERAGYGVADHQAYDADVAEQERYELPQIVLALLRPRFLPFAVVPPAAALTFHDAPPV